MGDYLDTPTIRCNGDVGDLKANSVRPSDGHKAEALALMVQGLSVKQIAAQLAVHRSTIYRWISEPEFQRDLAIGLDSRTAEDIPRRGYERGLR